VTVLSILSTIVPGLAGSVLGYEYRRRREASQQAENQKITWFDESLDIIGRGIFNIERALFRSNPDYDRILTELGQSSERLYIKSKNPPNGVPESAVATVSTVAKLYAKATAVAEVNTEKDGKELLTELFEMAKKEDIGENDLEGAIESASEVSTRFSKLMSMANNEGIGSSELAEVVKEIISDWETEEFVEFISIFHGESGDAEENIEFTMRMFFGISHEISKQSYNVLQEERDEISS